MKRVKFPFTSLVAISLAVITVYYLKLSVFSGVCAACVPFGVAYLRKWRKRTKYNEDLVAVPVRLRDKWSTLVLICFAVVLVSIPASLLPWFWPAVFSIATTIITIWALIRIPDIAMYEMEGLIGHAGIIALGYTLTAWWAYDKSEQLGVFKRLTSLLLGE